MMKTKEANKEESDRCVKIALMCFQEGHKEKALKFLHKAQRLCPSAKITGYIRQMESMANSSAKISEDYGAFDHYEQGSEIRNRFGKDNTHPNPGSPNSNFKDFENNNNESFTDKNTNSTPKNRPDSTSSRERSRSRVRSTKTGGVGALTGSSANRGDILEPQLGIDYNEEQLVAVQRVKSCKDYYGILNVLKDVTIDELKKQYKKLALKLHPDKNRAPGASEAFKAVGNAYAVLSDPVKRERYDMYGGNESNSDGDSSNSFYEYDYSRGFESDMTADEIFNMFFGSRFGSGGHTDQRSENNYSVMLQLMPLIVLVVLSVCGQFLIADPVFSLHQNSKYTDQRITRDMRVMYYVKPEFLKTYHSSLHRIEKLVEEEFINNLRTNCFNERTQREAMMWRARAYGDNLLYAKAHALNTPSCDRLSEIYS